MDEDYGAAQEADGNGAYAYPEDYDANYANYYQQQQEGNYYASYQQDGYEGYYYQQEGEQRGTDQYSYDPNYNNPEGQDYSYYAADQGYGVEQEAYATEDGQQTYLDQLAVEQTTGYYYDDQGNLIEYAGAESPTNVFNQEAYWQDNNNLPDTEDTTPGDQEETLPESEGLNLTESTPQGSTLTESVSTPEGNSARKIKKEGKNGRTSSPSRKKKTKKERVAQRQALLEKEEEEKLRKEEAPEAANSNNNSSGEGSAAIAKTTKVSTKKVGFVERGKAKFQMKLRIAKAIKRDRMPVQIRILPVIRKHLTPMDKYFGSESVECVLSDIFWSSIKGDINRVKHLVEVEGESPTDSKLDPWNLHQTPLHWAAKGGSVHVINYLLGAGASPRCLDENGSLPLHLSCWAGHVNASIVLLRASDAKDLYVQDYDGAMCPLDWANARGHTKLLEAIEKYQDSLWLPKFVDDLIRGIIRYKIKIFKDPPKKLLKAEAKDQQVTVADQEATVVDPNSTDVDKSSGESFEIPTIPTSDSSAKKSLLKRSKTDQKLEKANKAASSKSVG